jgi:predicted molibdopterin-dependent oxidoreductase YjgC
LVNGLEHWEVWILTVDSDRRLTGAVSRGKQIQIVVDGEVVPAFDGESVAAAVLAAGRRALRVTPRRGDQRGMYCGIGICFDCVMTVEGQRVRTCLTPVKDGMRIGTQNDGDESSIAGRDGVR